MKALTVYQPWASLIMLGAKPWEFRQWDYTSRYKVQGARIVIHASAREIKPKELLEMRKRIADGESGLDASIALPLIARLLDCYKCRGVLELAAGLGTAVIGTPRRVGAIFSGTIDSERLDHRMYGWPMGQTIRFPHPVPCRGGQGFWNWPYEVNYRDP